MFPDRADQDGFERVVSFLHWDGMNHDKLTDDEIYEIFAEGDGFGYLDAATLRTINSGYDWSHVRDSTDAGVARMVAKLDDVLARKTAVSA
jgi:hypothetical protein